MKLRRIDVLLIATMLVFGACARAAADAPTVDGAAIAAETRAAMAREDFAALERSEATLRTTKAMQQNGVWALRTFYFTALGPSTATRDLKVVAAEEAFLDRWHAAYPRSLAWPVLAGQTYSKHAFLLRGGEYADRVTPEQWAGYRKYMALSRQTFMSRGKDEESNPAWYAARMIAASSDTLDLPEFTALLRASLALAPDYNEPLRAVVHYASPQWGGSPAMVEGLAQVALKIAGPEAYAVLYTEAYRTTGCGCEYKPAQLQIQWPVFERGMRSRLQHLHGAYTVNMYAALSCNAGHMAVTESLKPRLIETGKMAAAWREFDQSTACVEWVSALPAAEVSQ